MAKIRLDLDALSVESFSTSESEAEKGTVFGHIPPDTYARYCSDGTTCLDSECIGACGTGATDCGTCATACGTCATDCGTCATGCGTCYDYTCANTYCGTCNTNCGTCDPYCCCTCSCYV